MSSGPPPPTRRAGDDRHGFFEGDPSGDSTRAALDLFRLHRDLRRLQLEVPEMRP